MWILCRADKLVRFCILVLQWQTCWFRGSSNSIMLSALRLVSLISAVILAELNPVYGIAGWQWLFVIESISTAGLMFHLLSPNRRQPLGLRKDREALPNRPDLVCNPSRYTFGLLPQPQNSRTQLPRCIMYAHRRNWQHTCRHHSWC